MAGTITLCGLLSPEGELEECEGYGHTALAETICRKRYHNSTVYGIHAEDFLLDHGYLCLRNHDAYMHYWDKDGNWMALSAAQMKWINDHINQLVGGQKKDILEIYSDMDGHERWAKEAAGITPIRHN